MSAVPHLRIVADPKPDSLVKVGAIYRKWFGALQEFGKHGGCVQVVDDTIRRFDRLSKFPDIMGRSGIYFAHAAALKCKRNTARNAAAAAGFSGRRNPEALAFMEKLYFVEKNGPSIYSLFTTHAELMLQAAERLKIETPEEIRSHRNEINSGGGGRKEYCRGHPPKPL
jgi:hypothetical protein